jgi:ubiquinone/menaquinone biosynthesis C-methylase UbiE
LPFVLGALVLVAGLLLYWELVIAEGTHLGPGVVVWLYDLVAPRYEQIKNFKLGLDDGYIGWPLAVALVRQASPRVLDVAAGTGRVARSVLRQVAFTGVVVNADLSARMLREGRSRAAVWPGRAAWLRSPDDRLPFADGVFDAVTCLEALEFFPRPAAALAECVRVLRAGGSLIITNRIGLSAPFLVGKTFTRAAFRRRLAALPLEAVRVEPWQAEYDLAWARKRSRGDEDADHSLLPAR